MHEVAHVGVAVVAHDLIEDGADHGDLFAVHP